MSSHVISPFLCREVCDQHRLPFLASSLHLALYSRAGAVTEHSIAGVLFWVQEVHQHLMHYLPLCHPRKECEILCNQSGYYYFHI